MADKTVGSSRRKRKREASGLSRPVTDSSVSEEDSASESAAQVMYFTSYTQLAEYTKTLNIHRIRLTDLLDSQELDSTDEWFVGGMVTNHLEIPQSQYSQCGKTQVFIQDESVSDDSSYIRHLLVEIDVDIVEKFNIPALTDDHELYVHKVSVCEDETMFSEDMGIKIIASGGEARVWIVHRDANKDKFFQKRCGKKFWKKRKKKQLAKKRAENEKQQVEPSTSEVPPSPPPSSSRQEEQVFPDVSDFPESAFEDDHMDVGERSRPSVSSPSLSSEDDSSYSDSESDLDSRTESDIQWVPKPRKTGKTGCKYVYTKLADLRPSTEKVNVFGVVKEFTAVGPTRGSDYSCTLTLVDETDPRVGVKCILFNKNKDLLPHVKKVDEIVCIHRAFVKEFQYAVQLNGVRFTSVLQFSSNIQRKIKPKTGSLTYTFLHQDRLRVRELREWVHKMKRNETACKLDAVHRGAQFGLSCQVVSVCELESPVWCTVLTVWDGSVLPLKAKKVAVDSVQTGFSATARGYDEQVFVYDKKCLRRKTLVPGTCVFLHGVHALVCSGRSDFEVELCLGKRMPGSLLLQPAEIEVLASNDFSFNELQLQLERTSCEGPLVTASLLTGEPYFTLEEIKSLAAKDGGFLKFRCRVKLVGVANPSLTSTVRLQCSQCGHFEPVSRSMDINESGVAKQQCRVCIANGQVVPESTHPSCMYFMKVLLSDHTGQMEAHVPHSAAMLLLGDTFPTNFYTHREAGRKVKRVLARLTGGNSPFDTHATVCPRPWLDASLLKVRTSGGAAGILCLCETALASE